ncbi:MAG: enoyl-CoA hydratase [Halobacteriovoraceae bacterium]|nr:enoyl-CoA hydratase [Halobacteriovoraceae bacterium]
MLSLSLKDLPNYENKELGTSDWLTIDQARINEFAKATNDYQWIHIDEERAKKELPTKSTIAHGFLTLSLITHLGETIWEVKDASQIINYGLNKVRFLAMVPSQSKIRLKMKILKVENLKSKGYKVIGESTMVVEGQEKPALIAEFIALFYF